MSNNYLHILRIQAAVELVAGDSISVSLMELVKEEVLKLKAFATREELSKIDLPGFNSRLNTQCIYGQMTGNCNNPRSIQLLNLCALPFTTNLRWFEISSRENFDGRDSFGDLKIYSALEFYISNVDRKEVQQLMEQLKAR